MDETDNLHDNEIDSAYKVLLDSIQTSETVASVKKKSSELGVPVIEEIVEVSKLFDYEDITRVWSKHYDIPLKQGTYQVDENRDWYLLFDDGTVGIFAPYNKADVEKVIDDESKTIYLVSYELFKQRAITTEGALGEFVHIVKEAQELGATDIHFEKKERFMLVRLRILGDLVDYITIANKDVKRMLKAIKTEAQKTSNIDTEEWQKGQDARIDVKELQIDLRLSFTPSVHDGYQNLVIRLLTKETTRVRNIYDLQRLGYAKEDIDNIAPFLEYGAGLNIMSGATGSGKSRSVNVMLASMDSKKNIRTVEDPVEYKLENAVQHQTFEVRKDKEEDTITMGFLEFVIKFMRQDPDVIFVGEWRKVKELTDTILYAAETGHLVWTTLHTSRVISTPNMLINQYGLTPDNIANTINIIINQKLVKKVCPHCSTEAVLTEEDIKGELRSVRYQDRDKLLGLVGKKTIKRNPDGCAECIVHNPINHEVIMSGYLGRTALYEYLVFSNELRELVLTTTTSLEIEKELIAQSKLKKGKTYVDIAIDKVLAQDIDLAQALKTLKG